MNDAQKEREAIVAYIETQIIVGDKKLEALLKEYPENHMKPRMYVGAVVALKRLNDAIERGDHLI